MERTGLQQDVYEAAQRRAKVSELQFGTMVHVISWEKKGELYIFSYDAERWYETFKIIDKFTQNPELNLGWGGGVALWIKIKEEKARAEEQRRLSSRLDGRLW